MRSSEDTFYRDWAHHLAGALWGLAHCLEMEEKPQGRDAALRLYEEFVSAQRMLKLADEEPGDA